MYSLSELQKRLLTSVIGVVVVVLCNYFDITDYLVWIVYLALYSELLIMCYASEIPFYKRLLVYLIGLAYLMFGIRAFAATFNVDDAISFDALYCLFAVFSIDICAYVFGKLIQGPKLIPKISPNKTIAGFIAGTIAGMLAFHFLLSEAMFNDEGIHFVYAFLFTLCVQAGDLFVSYGKRICCVKHASDLLPGHGGFWDRFDSILAAIIFIYLVQNVRIA